MSLLFPWALLGALAVAIPVYVHLRARVGRVVPFTALRFLEDQPRPPIRGLRLRDLLLLASRTLGLMLLAVAFAWPYRPTAAALVVESRVYVLDNTMSQQAAGGFERARRRLVAEREKAPAEVQVAVVELRDRARVIVGLADSRDEALARLGSLAPSFERGSLVEALRLAQSLLSQSLGARKRIIIESDHQENQWAENESSPPFLDGVEVLLAEKPALPVRPNLSLAEPTVRRVFLGDKSVVDLGVQLRHEGPAQQARVRLTVEGREILREEVKLAKEVDTLTLQGRWESDPGAWLAGEMTLEDAGDDLAADDRVFFCLPPVREGRVALLARSPYLRAALSPEIMKGRFATRPLDPSSRRLAEAPESELAEVLVLEGDYAQSEQVRHLAFRYLGAGRGVLLILERTTPLVSAFLRELGFEPRGPASDVPEGFRYVAPDHPLFRPFVLGGLGDLAEVRIARHLRVSGSRAVPLAVGASGDPLILEGTATQGRLLVFAFGLDRPQSDWPLKPTFIPFLDLALQHARGATPMETSAEPGQIFAHLPPPEQTPGVVVLRDGTRELERASLDTSRRARFRAPSRPGIYALTYDDAAVVQAMVAVNPSPKESVLRYVEAPAALAAWTLPPSGRPPDPPGEPSLRSARDQRLWWWALLAGAVLLVLEGLLAFRLDRRGSARARPRLPVGREAAGLVPEEAS